MRGSWADLELERLSAGFNAEWYVGLCRMIFRLRVFIPIPTNNNRTSSGKRREDG